MRQIMAVVMALCGFVSLICADASAQEGQAYWPTWRGPAMNGVAPKGNPPVTWSESKNVKWKIEVPGQGTSSPIIWGDKLFFQTAVDTGKAGQAPAPALAAAREEGRGRRGPDLSLHFRPLHPRNTVPSARCVRP